MREVRRIFLTFACKLSILFLYYMNVGAAAPRLKGMDIFMREVKLDSMVFGEGKMKICVPVCAKTRSEVLAEIEEIKVSPAELIEWRMDYFEEDILEAAESVFEAAGKLPVLCTFRTKAEGGERDIDPVAYFELYASLAERGAKMVDLELSICGALEDYTVEFIRVLHDMGIIVVISNHDFKKTPAKEDMKMRFEAMVALGADLPKIAVMANDQRDVMTLFSAMAEVSETCWPLIGISMGQVGSVSRVRGSIFGCAVTFASLKGKASAPGQLDAETLAKLL